MSNAMAKPKAMAKLKAMAKAMAKPKAMAMGAADGIRKERCLNCGQLRTKVQFGRWWKSKRRFCTVGHCKVDRRSARMRQLNALQNSVRNMDSARQSAKARHWRASARQRGFYS